MDNDAGRMQHFVYGLFILTVSIVGEGHITYPDDDELKEMFGVL